LTCKIKIKNIIKTVYIKDEGQSDDIYGGNKTRVLEIKLAEAINNKKKGIIVYGAYTSSFVQQSILQAVKHNLYIIALVFRKGIKDKYETDENILKNYEINNTKLIKIIDVGNFYNLPIHLMKIKFNSEFKDYILLKPGGSDKYSCFGHANAYLEMLEQCSMQNLYLPEFVIVPAGTGGTLAGLVIGSYLSGINSTIIGACVVERILTNKFFINRLLKNSTNLLKKIDIKIDYKKLTNLYNLKYESLGKGYGHPLKSFESLKNNCTNNLGFNIDYIYSGKALDYLVFCMDDFLLDKNILFWNTYNNNKIL